MKKTILGVMALAVGGLGAGAVLMAAGPQDPARQGRGQDGRFQRMAEYLGLTEEQQATWKSLHLTRWPCPSPDRDLPPRGRSSATSPTRPAWRPIAPPI